MSSNQNDNQSRRIKSIRRALTSRTIWRKIGDSFATDVLVLLVIIVVWLLATEYYKCGSIDFLSRAHYLTFEDSIGTLDDHLSLIDKVKTTRYKITEKDSGRVLCDTIVFASMEIPIILLCIIFVVQFVLHWLSWPSENGKIRKVLKPLDDLALKADEIAKMDFSEDKYHVIEEKITSLEPDEEQLISLGDEDLLGIEKAMNNLLIRMRESNRQQARFVNDASHELRTPIAVIQGYANMLARWGRDDEKVLDESIVAIKNESDNMKRLVEQLLFLARGDAGRTVIDKKSVNLKLLMEEVYEESLMIDENHIYRFVPLSNTVTVLADEGLIKQALRILVDNAAKYTKEKDEIILSVGYNDAGKAFLQVQDSGIGMKEADVEHMFERFYRADEARSYNGTGLGLSIAKWIVDKHGGHFEILSREELGTRITMYI